MPGASAGDLVGHNLGSRTESGWQTESIGGGYETPRFILNRSLFGPNVEAISSDFSSAILTFGVPMLPGAPPSPSTGMYLWSEGGGLTLIADIGEEGKVDGASSDLARIVFSTTKHMLPSDAGRSGESVYVSEGSTLRQVDVATDGSLLSACGSSVPIGGVADSGERIYFVNPADSDSCGSPSRIFLRDGHETTTEVSASHCSGENCGEAQAASFAGATQSGSVAFFTTTQRLTNADENSKRDLYRFTAETGALELVSPGSAGMEGEVTIDPVLTSTDGSIAYFYSLGPLLPGQGTSGSNLYVADQSGIHLVASVNPSPLDISSDGQFAALATPVSLDAADTDASVDTYLYDEEEDSFIIVSHGPSGGNGAFDATTVPSIEKLFDVPVRHALSEGGSRVFFETAEQLLPDDTNEARDVYEWDAGRLGLISSGRGKNAAKFAGASPDGQTVVILTAVSLLPGDRDGGDLDLYAARPGGGFDEVSAQPSPCDSCIPAKKGSTSRPVAASLTGSAARQGRIRLQRVGGAACRDLLRSGQITLAAAVPAPGRVAAVATGLVDGRVRVLMRGVAGSVAPGGLKVHLVATHAARHELRIRGRLRVRLVLRQASRELVRGVTLNCGVHG